MRALIVTMPFADYAKGAMITDPTAMRDAQEHHAAHVVRTNVDDTVLSAESHANAKAEGQEPAAPAAKK